MKTLAYMWKTLPPLERMTYEKIADTDKSRYFEELAQYSGPMQVPNKRQKKPPVSSSFFQNFPSKIPSSLTDSFIVGSSKESNVSIFIL